MGKLKWTCPKCKHINKDNSFYCQGEYGYCNYATSFFQSLFYNSPLEFFALLLCIFIIVTGPALFPVMVTLLFSTLF